MFLCTSYLVSESYKATTSNEAPMKTSSKVTAILLLFSCFNYSVQAQETGEAGKDTINVLVADSLLNRGNEQDVSGLVSGLFSGMLVSTAGSDPNRSFDALVRGVGTVIGNPNPLVVIDGLVGVPMSMIDLNDIESVRLLKGAETSRYGMQGANGVLEIFTKGFYGEPIQVSFNQSVFLEDRIYREKVMDADAFLAFGGQDLGARTNWHDEILESTVSSISNLSVNGSSGKLSYYASANMRLVDGILRETGFDRQNLLAKLQWRPGAKLKIGYSAAYSSNEADLGFGRTFKYANKLNPTSPIYFENGDLYNAIAFDYINPLSFVEDAYRKSDQQIITQNITVEKQLGKGTLSLNGGYWTSSGGSTTEFSPDFVFGYYVGNSTTSAFDNEGYNATIAYEGGLKNIGKIEFKETLTAGTFSRVTNTLNRRIFNEQFEDVQDTDELQISHVSIGADARLNSYMTAQIYLRYEQASTLGDNNNSGLFPAINAQIDLGQKFEKLKDFGLNLGYGVSGLTLYDDDYAKNGDASPFFFAEENPNLGYEKSTNTELEITYQPTGKPWQLSLTRFGRKASELMGLGAETPTTLLRTDRSKLLNDGELMNSGWEVEGQYVLTNGAIRFTSSITASTLKTEWKSHPANGAKMGFLERANRFVVLSQEGQPYGALSGFQAVVRNDNIVFLDTNGDIAVDSDDEIVLGQALPSFWLGWRNQLQYGNTTLSLLIESVAGHSIMNTNNYLLGSEDLVSITENGLAERLGYEGFPLFPSSLFIENASFVRLRYISIDQQVRFGNLNFTVYGVANNLFTLTKFSGNDPSPRITDYFNQNPYYSNIPGIQRTTEWLPSRSFMLGVKVRF